MFCFQCEETANNQGCTVAGVCGKKADVADLQDQLIYLVKGISYYTLIGRASGFEDDEINRFVTHSLFSTITNANFNGVDFQSLISRGFILRNRIKQELAVRGIAFTNPVHAALVTPDELTATKLGVLSTADADKRALRELLTYGVKGICAYAYHAYTLGYKDIEIFNFVQRVLVATIDDSVTNDDLFTMVSTCGKMGIKVMALLDKANTSTYGNPEPTHVNIGTRNNPGILISGHDLGDINQLLLQTQGTGVDVYTHGEMLPANSYPAFKKYKHLVGNYGGSWWKQSEEFEKFNGPILMTTNCLIPPKVSYRDRVYTTGVVGFEGLKYISKEKDGSKDFARLIEHAKACAAPQQLESGTIIGGFAHNAIMSYADKIVAAIKSGKIRKFIVMGGCDGRHKEREYYTEFAKDLPTDTVILTAGCAKYRYNKLNLGFIEGIPRVLDAGQCNDSYSLVLVAQKLAEAFGKTDLNELPISYNLAWYEQKAVLVLIVLLHLGIKNITLGPRLPAFLSEPVLKILVERYNLKLSGTVEKDMEVMV